MGLFTVSDDPTHRAGDAQCSRCFEPYPEPCRCGGLMHAASGSEDTDGNVLLVTQCDQCGRAEDQLDEI